MSKFDRFSRSVPGVFKPTINPIVKALLETWGQEHDEAVTQLKNTKSEIFVKSGSGQYLDRLGSSVGVSRPSQLGLIDEDFRDLIPKLSLEAKQVRKLLYEVMDVFWGPLFSRANTQTSNSETFNVSPGDYLDFSVDGGATIRVTATASDIATPGAATAEEIAEMLARETSITTSVIDDDTTNSKYVNIRTNTLGARGSIQIFSTSTMVGTGKLEFDFKKHRVYEQSQRTVIYEVRPRELIIELPAIVPALKRTLKGSHHWHADATLEGPEPPENGIWAGSFLYSTSGVSYTLTGRKAAIQENLEAGNVYTKVTVDDASDIPNEQGYLIFGFGTDAEEQPVRYISRPNSATILLDPSYTFQKDHFSGENVNFLLPELTPATPRITGEDLAIYLTSPSGARALVQEILRKLVAAGVVINFVILLPEYRYLVTNPYEVA